MIRVIIVDDEILARIGIQSLLENMEEVCVAGTFGDAGEALDFLKTTLVDIVVTDIEMPGMNGLEFIKKIREENLAEGIIILSCYDRFEYAREAISLGTDGYILKHDISRDTIKKEIEDVARKISGRKKTRKRQEMPESFSIDEQKIMSVGVIRIQNSQELVEEKMVRHLLDEIVSHYKMGCLMDSKKRNPFIIFQFSKESSKEERKRLLEDYIEILEMNFFQYTNQKIVFGISNEFFHTQDIPSAYEEGENALELRFYQENRTIFFLPDIQWKEEAPELLFSEEEFTAEKGMDLFEKELCRYLSICRVERIKVKAVKEMMVQAVSAFILNILRLYVRDKEITASWRNQYSFVETISQSDTCSQLEKNILVLIGRFHEEIRQFMEMEEIGEILQYINGHMDEKMTLEELAELQQMSVSAFSKKFKEKTAMTPVQYINQKKVEKVKEYLKMQEYTLGEIAELTGFSNENYMVRVFKKITGQTITDFRRKFLL